MPNNSKIKVTHIITSLDAGGANMMLYKLVSRMDRTKFDNRVVSMMDLGPLGPRIQEIGIPVYTIGMSRGIPNPLAIPKLMRLLRREAPDIVQTWTYHADLMGGAAAKMTVNSPIVWNIQHSTLEAQTTKQMTIWTAKLCSSLSQWIPIKMICCSKASHQTHLDIGYAADKMVFIPNAFDLETFQPDPAAKTSVRQELGISPDSPLIGLVNRFHPMKDHHNFVRAAAILHRDLPECHFLLCGHGITWENEKLATWIHEVNLQSRFHLLGQRQDIPRIMASLDIATLSSSGGEGLPNVVGEAMCCGVPCVVTDVGDSARVVGETGVTVPIKDAQALADGWRRILIAMTAEERRQLGLAARHRIETKYNLTDITRQYEHVYESITNGRLIEHTRTLFSNP